MGFSETGVNPDAAWEYLVVTTPNAGGARVFDTSGYGPTAGTAITAASGADGIELLVPWTAIGLTGVPATPLRFTVASFRCLGNDLDVADIASYSDALDAVTDYGSLGKVLNTFADVGDGIVNYYFEVEFAPSGEVVSPILVTRFQASSDAANEFAMVTNRSARTVALDEYGLGDADVADGTEYLGKFPAGVKLASGSTYVVCPRLDACPVAGHAEIDDSDANSADDMRGLGGSLAGSFDLASSDELVLLGRMRIMADVVTWGSSNYLGVTPIASFSLDQTYKRQPFAADTDNCTTDFTAGEPASIDLLGFSAARTAAGVELAWETGSEVDCGVFTLLRCNRSLSGCSAAADHRELPGLVVPCPGSASGAAYRAADGSAAAGRAYSYYLREHETGGGMREYGPALVGPAVPPLPAPAGGPGAPFSGQGAGQLRRRRLRVPRDAPPGGFRARATAPRLGDVSQGAQPVHAGAADAAAGRATAGRAEGDGGEAALVEGAAGANQDADARAAAAPRARAAGAAVPAAAARPAFAGQAPEGDGPARLARQAVLARAARLAATAVPATRRGDGRVVHLQVRLPEVDAEGAAAPPPPAPPQPGKPPRPPPPPPPPTCEHSNSKSAMNPAPPPPPPPPKAPCSPESPALLLR